MNYFLKLLIIKSVRPGSNKNFYFRKVNPYFPSLNIHNIYHVHNQLFIYDIFHTDVAKLTHIHMKLSVDFDMEVFGGSVELDIEKVDPNATEITMDARGLHIQKMFDMKSGKKLDYILHKEGFAGSKLEIMLPTSNSKK